MNSQEVVEKWNIIAFRKITMVEEDPLTITHLLNELEGPDASRVTLVIR